MARVAVVGGGIGGTLASLVLKNRGLQPILIDRGQNVGGRLRGSARSKLQNRIDAGCQFFRPSDFRLLPVFRMLEEAGLLAKWDGRFGMYGKSGGFLPSSIVGQATAGGMMNNNHNNNTDDNGEQQSLLQYYTDTGDFCGFVTNHRDKTPTYVGVPDNNSLCQSICRLGQIDQILNTNVTSAKTEPGGGWKLEVESSNDGTSSSSSSLKFDSLILASHDPTLAAETVQSIVDAEEAAAIMATGDDTNEKHENTKANDLLQDRLNNLVKDLEGIRDSRKPIFTWSGRFDNSNNIDHPFDAVSVPGSNIVQFIVRESSKPGRRHSVNSNEDNLGEIWTAVSTSSLARDILHRRQTNAATASSFRSPQEEAADIMSREVSHLLFGKGGLSDPASLPIPDKSSTAVRWGSAFTSKTLGLKEDSVFLQPWRLCIAGDYIRTLDAYPTPFEAACLSGLEAGERIAALFGPTDDEIK